MKIKTVIIVAGILFVSMLTAGSSRGNLLIPVGIRHFTHLIFPPVDLYEPIVNDEYLFWEEGFSKRYLLKPKYLDIYEIGLHSPTNHLPAIYKFQGIIKVQFFSEDKLLFEKEISSQIACDYVADDMTHYKNVSLLNFEIPLLGKYKNDISVKLTVLKPDLNLEKYSNSLKMYIAVSSIP
jgi:hypothetical protein